MDPLLEMIEPTTNAPGKRRGFRLWRVEVLNWGTLGENSAHGVELRGDWLCITGRNGTGKSTLADAIITAFPPNRMRIHYNAAGGAKNTKERTSLTYLRGYYGHEQDDTGKAKPSTLRDKPGTLTAILLQFHEEKTSKWVTVLVLGTFNAQDDEQWLYGIREGKLDLESVKGKEDWDTRAKRLRKEGWNLTADAGPYRDRLREWLKIPSDKAINTFVRTVGLKDIGDVNAFIRGNMLNDVSVHERYVDLTKHYQKQLEIDAEIETTRNMIAALKPLAEIVPAFRALSTELNAQPQIEAAVAWRLAQERANVLEELIRLQQEQVDRLTGEIATARNVLARVDAELQAVNESEPAKRAAGLAVRATELGRLRRDVEERRNHLQGALQVIGMKMPADAASFAGLRAKLDELVRQADQSDEERGDGLTKSKLEVERLQKERTGVQKEIDAATASSSHLPWHDLELRASIAREVGLKPADLPFIGELVDVDPAHKEWRVALEKLLRAYARRILVPMDKFGAVAQFVNDNNFGTRVRLEKVPVKTMRFTMSAPDPRRAYARLKIKPQTPFGDWLHNALMNQFDHVCFTSVKEYDRHSGAALTLEGLVKGRTDYHEKRDDIQIHSPQDYFLGWDNEEKVRALKARRAELDERLKDAALVVKQTRDSNETARQRRDMAKEVLAKVAGFELIDLSAVNENLAALEKQRQQLAKADPDAAKAEKRIGELVQDKSDQEKGIEELVGQKGRREQERDGFTESLKEIDESEVEEPAEAERAKAAGFFLTSAPVHAKNLVKWVEAVEERMENHFKALDKQARELELKIQAVMSSYLSTFTTEVKDLEPKLSAADAFLERLRVLQDEKLDDLLDRFRKNLEGNLALHVTQLKGELESQVGDSEKRIREINQILELIPWEGKQVVRILPRPNPQVEIREFRELLTRASAPLLAPSTDQKLTAFVAVKELIKFLGDDSVRKLALDARHWQLFAVELRNLAIEDPTKQRKFYIENTDGLSGGEKNKLSVTLLASALAFQYDIAGARATPGTFRTVIIDEAFARLDSENARYALELFKKFDFQLILVHPLHGTVRVAEDYVQGFLLATIREDRYSALTSVRIEDFRRLVAEAEAKGGKKK